MDKLPGGGGGGGCTPLCRLYRPCAAPSGSVFLTLFGLKTGIHFAHFGLESGMVFEGTTGVYERIYHINSKWVRKGNMGIGNGFEDFFCLRCNLRPGLKTGMEFRGLVWKRVCKITFLVRNRVRIDLENRAAHHHHEFPGVPPRDELPHFLRRFGALTPDSFSVELGFQSLAWLGFKTPWAVYPRSTF